MGQSKQDKQIEEALENVFKNPTLVLAGAGAVALYFLYNHWDTVAAQLSISIGWAWVGSLLTGMAIAAAVALGIWVARSAWVLYYNQKHYKYYQILPHADDEVTPATLGEFMRRAHGSKRSQWKRLLYGKEYFSFTIHYKQHPSRGKQYVFYIGAPRDRLEVIKHHMTTLYAKAEFYPAEQMEWPSDKAKHGRLMMRRKKDGAYLSLTRYKTDQLPSILNSMDPNTWIQLNFSPDSEFRMKRRIIKAEKNVKKNKNYRERTAFDREEEKSYKTRYYGNEVSFNVTLSVASEQDHPKRSHYVNKRTATALEAVMHDVNELGFRWGVPRAVNRFPVPYPYKMVWTGSEIATLFHLPDLHGSGLAQTLAKNIPHGTKGTQQLPPDVLSNPKGYSFGTLVHPLLDTREVKVMLKSLGKQWGLTGITGSGKSTVLNTIFKSFVEVFVEQEKAPGFSFIDPKKETATIALNQMLKMETEGHVINWEKVHWVSFKDADTPPAMNLLHKMPGVPETVLVDQIMRIIRESGFGVAMQAERLLEKSLQTLIADDGQGHTILGVRKLLLHDKFRRQVLARLRKDPANLDVVQFWEEEAEGLLDQSGNAILNRLDSFSSNPFLRRIFGQTGFSFPIRKWMDDGHIVFYDFNGMSEKEIGLIGGYLSYLYYRVADTRPDGSMLHQFVIDEAQRVKASILPEIHAEMRSKGLSLGISTQTMEKLDDGLKKSLVNVVANMFVCKQGQDGAALASKIFRSPQPDGKDVPMYSEGFLKTLPERTCVIKTEDNGKTVYAVVEVPPLDRYLPNGQKATYENKKETDDSNRWTYQKAKELESKNGLPIREIDEQIKNYMEGTDYTEEPVITPEPKPAKQMEPPPGPSKVVNMKKEKSKEVNLFD